MLERINKLIIPSEEAKLYMVKQQSDKRHVGNVQADKAGEKGGYKKRLNSQRLRQPIMTARISWKRANISEDRLT